MIIQIVAGDHWQSHLVRTEPARVYALMLSEPDNTNDHDRPDYREIMVTEEQFACIQELDQR